MSRVQLALNVADLEASISFYSAMLGTEPAKLQPGYANFAIADPPLKLVLIEGGGVPGTVNHLGVEVPDTNEVGKATERFQQAGLETRVQEATDCCYAIQDKVWVVDPDGADWEVYTVLADSSADPVCAVASGEQEVTANPIGCC